MASHIPRLRALLSPAAPHNACDWRVIEDSIKTPLPADFKEFWSAFGPGTLGFRSTDPEFLVLHSPYFEPGYLRFPDCVAIMGDNYRGLKSEFPQFHPHSVWPEPGGILGFGHDTNGNEYYFRTAALPRDWTIQLWGRHQDDEHFDMSFSEFLWEFVHNRIIIADGFQGDADDSSDVVWTIARENA